MQRFTLLLVFLLVPSTPADERLKGIACRSVHLGYPQEKGTVFYNEITIEQSAPGTYFMVCGWDKGYFGLQELGNGKKLLLFSVWDSRNGRVKLLHQDKKVRVGRFGGEGTGGQSFFDYDWKLGRTYRLMVTAKANGGRTEYAGWFYIPEEKGWKHLVTFSTVTGGRLLGGYYSFVEDFKRDRRSTKNARKARFGGGWVRDKEGDWKPITAARFTADRNPMTNIRAETEKGKFRLATGGATELGAVKLRDRMTLPEPESKQPPQDLPLGKD